jgi:hypothetical protein
LIETDQLLGDLEGAKVRLCAARDRVKTTPIDSPAFQGEMVSYLHAVVSHMSIVSVAQARQHQDLSDEADRLEAEVKGLRAKFEAIARPRLV